MQVFIFSQQKVACFIFLVCGASLMSCHKQNDNQENLTRKIDSLEQELEKQNKELAITHQAKEWSVFSQSFTSKMDKHGVANPIEYIDSSLRAETDLITLDAVLGGKMQFEQVKILGDKWVWASYSDGHIMGEAIYSFDVNKSGNPKFHLELSRER